MKFKFIWRKCNKGATKGNAFPQFLFSTPFNTTQKKRNKKTQTEKTTVYKSAKHIIRYGLQGTLSNRSV